MRTLKLDVEALSVDTFVTEEALAGHGTVRAHESVDDGGEEPGDGGDTKEVRTCNITGCGATCYSCPTGIVACCV